MSSSILKQAYLQKRITKSLNEQSNRDFKQKDLFYNNRTLRLTKRGKGQMTKYYEHWSFESPGVSAGNTINLLQKMQFPYYLDNKILVLFTEQDAFMARLAGAQGWLDGKE